MKRATVVIVFLVLSSLACSIQTSPAVTKTPAPTVVTVEKQVTTPSTTPEWTATVKLPMVNVRAEPNGKVIGSLTVGTTVTVKQCVGNWCQITNPNGWIFKGCLDVDSGLGCAAK